MSARSMGSATVSFGLVSIPVKIHAATQAAAAGVSFNMLHEKCSSRLKQQYVCPTCAGEVVPRDATVKGYEFEKGRFVTFKAEEIDALEAQSTETIDIVEFVPAEKVDGAYFEKPYYLGTEKGGEKAYRLLVEAMRRSGRVALAKYAARGKQYLVLVRPREGRLVMQTLRYAEEVRPVEEVVVPDSDVRDGELALAQQLIGQISSDEFHPENYRDEVKDRIEALIRKKVEGQQVVAAEPTAAPAGQIVDLMEALKASLAKSDGKAASAAPAAKPAKAKKVG